MVELFRKQLLDTTRGRIVSLLQGGGPLTSDDIATTVGLTRSAVRVQITAMERDGVVRRVGKRPGTTRPSLLFQLTPEVEQSLSKAYVPLLAQLVRVFAEVLPAQQMNSILRRTGKALAKELTRDKQPAGNLRARVAAASQILNDQLGATTRVESNGRIVIRGFVCPLAALTATHRGVCLALESLVREIVGTRVRECCERNERSRCCFEIEGGHSRRST